VNLWKVRSGWVFVGIVLVISGQVRAEDDSILACNREMRKTFEAS